MKLTIILTYNFLILIMEVDNSVANFDSGNGCYHFLCY